MSRRRVPLARRLNIPLKVAIIQSQREQCAVAASAGMSERRLSHIVTGYRRANRRERAALAKVLRTAVAALFPEEAV
jgi:hypothetical protein